MRTLPAGRASAAAPVLDFVPLLKDSAAARVLDSVSPGKDSAAVRVLDFVPPGKALNAVRVLDFVLPAKDLAAAPVLDFVIPAKDLAAAPGFNYLPNPRLPIQGQFLLIRAKRRYPALGGRLFKFPRRMPKSGPVDILRTRSGGAFCNGRQVLIMI